MKKIYPIVVLLFFAVVGCKKQPYCDNKPKVPGTDTIGGRYLYEDCNGKYYESEYPVLWITVYDRTNSYPGEQLPGMKVKLYIQLEDRVNDTNPVDSGYTNDLGDVVFRNLAPINYWAKSERDCLTQITDVGFYFHMWDKRHRVLWHGMQLMSGTNIKFQNNTNDSCHIWIDEESKPSLLRAQSYYSTKRTADRNHKIRIERFQPDMIANQIHNINRKCNQDTTFVIQ